jgi:ArsR family transcriptional regulator
MKPKSFLIKKINQRDKSLAKFLRIIGDDNRLQILKLLKGGECCVCEIFSELALPQNLVSSHLGIMHDFGLLKSRREGKRVYYSVNSTTIKKFSSFFIELLD